MYDERPEKKNLGSFYPTRNRLKSYMNVGIVTCFSGKSRVVGCFFLRELQMSNIAHFGDFVFPKKITPMKRCYFDNKRGIYLSYRTQW